MRYALIGCGRIATNHVKAVMNNRLEFIAACDIVEENIEKLQEKLTKLREEEKNIEEKKKENR